MQMKDRLAGAGAVIQDRAIAREDLAFARKLRSNQLQLSKYGLIFGGGFGQRLKMLARANQDVRRRLRADVLNAKRSGSSYTIFDGIFFAAILQNKQSALIGFLL